MKVPLRLIISFLAFSSTFNTNAISRVNLAENLTRVKGIAQSKVVLRGRAHLKRFHHTGETPLLKNFRRVLTMGKDRHMPLQKENQHAFMYNHWLRHWAEHWVDSSLHEDNTPYPEHRLLHEELYERYTTLPKRGTHKTQLRHAIPDIAAYESEGNSALNQYEVIYENDPFVKGHCISLEGRTKFPKFFVTLYDRDDHNQDWRKNHPKADIFLQPFEQILFYRIFGAYRHYVALLKMWQAYSQFALVVIPKHTEIVAKMGLIAPQTYPYTLKKTFWESRDGKEATLFDYGDYQVEETLTRLGEPQNKKLLYDRVGGGATQFLLQAADEYYIHDLVDVIENRDINYFSLQMSGNNCYWPGPFDENGKLIANPDTRVSHLLDKDYDRRPLDFPKGLVNMGLLQGGEYGMLQKIITETSQQLQ